MGRKKKMPATAEKPIRLYLPLGDYERLQRVAKGRLLSMAAYARTAVMEAVAKDLRRMGGEETK